MRQRMKIDLQHLIAAWQRSAALHDLGKGASEAEIQEFEAAVGWRLPSEWRRLYAFTNGADLLEGNLSFHPLSGGDLCLRQASASLRAWGWPVPMSCGSRALRNAPAIC